MIKKNDHKYIYYLDRTLFSTMKHTQNSHIMNYLTTRLLCTIFVMPALSMARYRDLVFLPSICSSVHQSVNICINPNFDLNHNVQVHFPRTIATVMILGMSLHLGITTQTAELYLTSTYISWFTKFVNLRQP